MLDIILEAKAEAERELMFAQAKLEATNAILAKVEQKQSELEAVSYDETADEAVELTEENAEFSEV